MVNTQLHLIQTYLADAIAAESSFESQLRNFASEGDDDEVKAAFANHADELSRQRQRLTQRLQELGGEPSSGKSVVARALSLTPLSAQLGHSQEERTVQNLIIAYTVGSAETAMYQSLRTVAESAGDQQTASLALEMQEKETRTAEKAFHFIPTRSKIAFNMLTVQEIDPAIETKVADDRLLS